jgi:hypothetical protein
MRQVMSHCGLQQENSAVKIQLDKMKLEFELDK